jgi:hypothetical protein
VFLFPLLYNSSQNLASGLPFHPEVNVHSSS